MGRIEWHCAYCAENGICQNELQAEHLRLQAVCMGKCKRYVCMSEARKKHNHNACDRELTPLTKYLIHTYRNENMTILQIAMLLDRTTTAIEKFLNKKNKAKDDDYDEI